MSWTVAADRLCRSRQSRQLTHGCTGRCINMPSTVMGLPWPLRYSRCAEPPRLPPQAMLVRPVTSQRTPENTSSARQRMMEVEIAYTLNAVAHVWHLFRVIHESLILFIDIRHALSHNCCAFVFYANVFRSCMYGTCLYIAQHMHGNIQYSARRSR